MIKHIAIGLLALTLVGCGFGPGKVRTETVYQEVNVPVSNVPMPPDTSCPQPRIETLDDVKALDDGEVAKAYRIAIEQLYDCSTLKELVINKYREIAVEDAKKIAELERKAMAAGPQGSAGPTADTANNKVITAPPIVELDAEETRRQVEHDEAFGELGNEFESLKNKDYDIE